MSTFGCWPIAHRGLHRPHPESRYVLRPDTHPQHRGVSVHHASSAKLTRQAFGYIPNKTTQARAYLAPLVELVTHHLAAHAPAAAEGSALRELRAKTDDLRRDQVFLSSCLFILILSFSCARFRPDLSLYTYTRAYSTYNEVQVAQVCYIEVRLIGCPSSFGFFFIGNHTHFLSVSSFSFSSVSFACACVSHNSLSGQDGGASFPGRMEPHSGQFLFFFLSFLRLYRCLFRFLRQSAAKRLSVCVSHSVSKSFYTQS